MYVISKRDHEIDGKIFKKGDNYWRTEPYSNSDDYRKATDQEIIDWININQPKR